METPIKAVIHLLASLLASPGASHHIPAQYARLVSMEAVSNNKLSFNGFGLSVSLFHRLYELTPGNKGGLSLAQLLLTVRTVLGKFNP